MHFEELKTNYLSDSLGKLYLDEQTIIKEKSKLVEEVSLEYAKEKLGRKWSICLRRMLPICSYILCHSSSSSSNSFLQLPSTFNYYMYSKHLFQLHTNIPLLDTFKTELEANQRSNARALQDMQTLGIIRCVSNFKHFNDVHHNNVSYAYVCSVSAIHSIMSVYSVYFKYHFNTTTTTTVSTKFNTNTPLLDTFKDNLASVTKHSNNYNKYLPLLQNELERQTVLGEFKYHLKEDGSRAYAPFCSSENKHSNERKEILNSYFGKGKWQEWDRSASIYNLTYSYNTKQYMPNVVDLHAKMNGKNFESKKEREMFKLLNMTKYFSDGRKVRKLLESMISIQNKINEDIALTKKEISFYKNNIERANLIAKLSKAETIKDAVKWYIKERDKLIEAIGGKRIENDAIFIMEGVVNLATMNDLNEAGFICVSVYDGFYTNCFDNDYIESIYKRNITKYIIGE